MTTFVVLAGLMLIVPNLDQASGQVTSLTVLVLDTAHAGQQYGHPVLEHNTNVMNLNGTAEANLTGRWTISSAASGPIRMEDADRMLVLRQVYGGAQLPALRAGCLGANFETDCRIDGRPLLVAQLTFTGGWNMRPIDISKTREPRADFQDDSWWGFLRVQEGALPVSTGTQVQLAAGVILEARGGGAVTFNGAGADGFSNLQTMTTDLCQKHANENVTGICAIVRFLNTVKPQATYGEVLEIDHHHNLLYELFDPAPSPRYLLFLRANGSEAVMKKLYPTGGGSSSGIRPCIPPAMIDTIPAGM